MTVYELTREQLDELKTAYADQLQEDGISWGELAASQEIPDDIILEHYAGIEFVPDDFSCSSETE